MTSEEIKARFEDCNKDFLEAVLEKDEDYPMLLIPLWEIAYQLAVRNERPAKKDEQEEMDLFAQDTEKRLADNMLAAEVGSKRDAGGQRGEYVAVDADFFEHLLICMCGQKFLHERGESPEARKDQDIIDRAYQAGWELLRARRPPLFYIRRHFGDEMVDKWVRDLDEFCKSQPSPRSPSSEPSAEAGSQKP